MTATDYYSCLMCGVPLESQQEFDQHLKTEDHLTNLVERNLFSRDHFQLLVSLNYFTLCEATKKANSTCSGDINKASNNASKRERDFATVVNSDVENKAPISNENEKCEFTCIACGSVIQFRGNQSVMSHDRSLTHAETVRTAATTESKLGSIYKCHCCGRQFSQAKQLVGHLYSVQQRQKSRSNSRDGRVRFLSQLRSSGRDLSTKKRRGGRDRMAHCRSINSSDSNDSHIVHRASSGSCVPIRKHLESLRDDDSLVDSESDTEVVNVSP